MMGYQSQDIQRLDQHHRKQQQGPRHIIVLVFQKLQRVFQPNFHLRLAQVKLEPVPVVEVGFEQEVVSVLVAMSLLLVGHLVHQR